MAHIPVSSEIPRLMLIQMNVLRVHGTKPERKIREFQTVSVEQDGEVFSVVRVDVKQQRWCLARPEAQRNVLSSQC